MGKNSENKHIIISGVSRGLGAALASALLEHGYCVSGFSRKSSSETEKFSVEYDGKFFFQSVDISKQEDLRNFVKCARENFGHIFGVINNAGTVQEGILATLPEIEIVRMLTVNLEGAIRLARLCIRDMIVCGGGRVLNISSIVGARGYNGLTVYSATKAGLDGFTRGLAREVGRRNITVNSIAPGYMRTEMSSSLNNESLQQIQRRTPLGRLAEFEDIIPLARFLLSPEANFITAQTILVDGGISN